jgi:hypothetical protein
MITCPKEGQQCSWTPMLPTHLLPASAFLSSADWLAPLEVTWWPRLQSLTAPTSKGRMNHFLQFYLENPLEITHRPMSVTWPSLWSRSVLSLRSPSRETQLSSPEPTSAGPREGRMLWASSALWWFTMCGKKVTSLRESPCISGPVPEVALRYPESTADYLTAQNLDYPSPLLFCMNLFSIICCFWDHTLNYVIIIRHTAQFWEFHCHCGRSALRAVWSPASTALYSVPAHHPTQKWNANQNTHAPLSILSSHLFCPKELTTHPF